MLFRNGGHEEKNEQILAEFNFMHRNDWLLIEGKSVNNLNAILDLLRNQMKNLNKNQSFRHCSPNHAGAFVRTGFFFLFIKASTHKRTRGSRIC